MYALRSIIFSLLLTGLAMGYLEPTDKQEEIIAAVMDGGYTRILVGGAVGGAKTVGCLIPVFMLCKIFPGIRVAIVRKDMPTLKKTVIKSFWKFCPQPFFHHTRYNKTEQLAVASNGSEVQFMAENVHQDNELTTFDGLEVNVIFLEQVEEMTEKLYLKCVDRVGRWILPRAPEPLIIMSCNPHQGWVKKYFYTPYRNNEMGESEIFIPALPKDNPYLPESYLRGLEELKRRAPALYRKRVMGSWEAEDDVQQLISWEYIWACERLLEFPEVEDEEGNVAEQEVWRAMGVDVGRYGADPSVWYVLEGNTDTGFNVIHTESYKKTSGPQVIQKTKELVNEFEVVHNRVFMDTVGLGGFAYDQLLEDGYVIQSFVGGGTEDVKDIGRQSFGNMNDMVAWQAKEYIEAEKVGGIDNEDLRADLAVYRYDIKGERTINVWSKDKVKKDLHRSPDDGDAFKMGLWGATYDTVVAIPGVEFA